MKTKKKEVTLKIKRHASLTYRIAMDFAILFLVTGLFLLCVIMGLRMGSMSRTYKAVAEELVYGLESDSITEGALAEACTSLMCPLNAA